MIGWAGLWNPNGDPPDPALSARWKDRLGPSARAWARGPFAAVFSERVSFLENAGTVVLFDGRLDEDTLSADPGLPPAGRVLRVYRRFGDVSPARLTGDFALVLWDAGQGVLLLSRDALGVKPLHTAASGDGLLFSSHVQLLLDSPGVPCAPDRDVLARALVRGEYPVGRTFYRGILNVPPAHVLRAKENGRSLRRAWDFDPEKRLRLASFSEYASAFREVFDRAVRRRLSPGPAAVAVSGGVDSSAIFAAARRLDPSCFGLCLEGPRGTPADESVYVDALEKRAGPALHRFPYVVDGFEKFLPIQTARGEAPYVDLLGASQAALLSSARDRGARVLLTGHWGDQVLFPFDYLHDLFHRWRWGTLVRHLRGFGRWNRDVPRGAHARRFLSGVLEESLPGSVAAWARRRRRRKRKFWFTEEFRRVGEALSPEEAGVPPPGSAHFQSLHARVRAGYHVFSMEWNQKQAAALGMEMSYPFLDRDVIQFLMSVPGEIVNHGGVPKALLREACRDLLPPEVAARRDKGNPASVVEELLSRAWDGTPFPLDRSLPGRGAVDIISREHEERLERRGEFPGSMTALWDAAELAGLAAWLETFE